MKRLILLALILLLAACGSEEPAETEPAADVTDASPAASEEYVLPEADHYLTVTDSMGIEIGDTNYVFGQIAGVEFTPDGDIAVLDIQKMAIGIYSRDGEFITRVGRQGSGPGEFLLPVGFTYLPQGDLIVSDAMGGKLIRFDSSLEYVGDVIGFFPSPPAALSGVDSMAIVGMKPEFEQSEEGMFMGFTIARWVWDAAEPAHVYYTKSEPFDPTDLSSIGGSLVVFGASEGTPVFTSPMSSEEYTFTAWTTEGEEIFTFVDEDYERVLKSQEEIDLETEIVNARMVQQGMPSEMANWEPDPYRMSVTGLYPDDFGRLWVGKGTNSSPTFDVFDMEGNFLFTAAIDAGERTSTWGVLVSHDGFLAFDANPEDYPVVYWGDLPE